MTTPHCLIIGGTRGIGRALTRQLAADRQKLTVVARNVPPTNEPGLAEVHYLAADVTKPADVLDKVRSSIKTRGPLTAAVFLQRFRGAGDSWEGELRTSLSATKALIDELVAEFEPAGGAIVLVSSNASRFVARDQPLGYHVAKAGLNQMMRYYAAVHGEKGIRVNAVLPCAVIKDESHQSYLENEPIQALYRRITPLGRMGTADEVARVIAFLCGPQSSFVSGQEICVDGGMSLLLHDSLARGLTALR
jgi:NAD(P)-dependent dehydrogenase (short-subunit alcohol dehydrogenase family)